MLMSDSDGQPTYHLYRMKKNFTLGRQVTERDIENHRKLKGIPPEDYLVVLDMDDNVIYIRRSVRNAEKKRKLS